jgi:hypothetical protein
MVGSTRGIEVSIVADSGEFPTCACDTSVLSKVNCDHEIRLVCWLLVRRGVALARRTYSGSDLTLDVVARLPLPRTTLFTSASSLLSRTLCGVLRGW